MPARFRRISILTFLFISVSFRASSPSVNSFMIFESAPVEPYRKLILAVGTVETMNDTLSYNPLEEAAGYFQIRPIRLKEYNRRTGSNYTTRDLFNYSVSEKIFLYFADLIGPYDLERIARKWNGSGHMTTYYWDRIKEYL
jgi:hypothetical protein